MGSNPYTNLPTEKLCIEGMVKAAHLEAHGLKASAKVITALVERLGYLTADHPPVRVWGGRHEGEKE